MNDSSSKVALITGGSRGVGRACALSLATAGYRIAINHRNSPQQAAETEAAIKALNVEAVTIRGDISDDTVCRDMVDAVITAFGRLDVLINNAATTMFIPHDQLEAVEMDQWDRIFAVNVRGPFQCVRAAQPHLEAFAAGQVINITSIAGICGNGSSIPYCASKAAMTSMTQSLARALAPKIRVNAIAPGFIDSQWTHDGLGEDYHTVADRQRASAALGEIALPHDVADAVMSLLEGSRLITGQTLVVDGGALLGAKDL